MTKVQTTINISLAILVIFLIYQNHKLKSTMEAMRWFDQYSMDDIEELEERVTKNENEINKLSTKQRDE